MTDTLQTPQGTQPTTEQAVPSGEVVTAPPLVDYAKKFAASTRENQVVSAKNAELDRKLGELTNEAPPTDLEMQGQFPEWEDMTVTEQRLARENVVSQRKVNRLALAQYNRDATERRDREIANVLDSKPELKDKQKEFVEFIDKHPDADITLLASAFIGENITPMSPTPPPAQSPLENSGGSQPDAVNANSKGLTPDEIATLRRTNPKEWLRMIRDKKI